MTLLDEMVQSIAPFTKARPARLEVYPSRVLPFEETVEVYDIKTRLPYKVATGEMVHAFQIESKLYVSPYYYELLKQLPNDTRMDSKANG